MTPEKLSYADFAAKKEIEPFPGNLYEVAPGTFGRLKLPTLDVLEAYEKADEPMAKYMEQLAEGEVDQGRWIKVLYEAATAVAKVVLDGENGGALEVDWSRSYPQMCCVVRQHFFLLGWPTVEELRKSLQAQAAPETA